MRGSGQPSQVTTFAVEIVVEIVDELAVAVRTTCASAALHLS